MSSCNYPPPPPIQPPALPRGPPARRKRMTENKPSLLLSHSENAMLFEILGEGRCTLATAVVQLLIGTPDQLWEKRETGVICLIRDTIEKSYFIDVFSLLYNSVVFRQEIYNEFEYEMSLNSFLQFEGDESMVGINFADETEAASFSKNLDSKLEGIRKRNNQQEIKSLSNNQSQLTSQGPPSSSVTISTYVFPSPTRKSKYKKLSKGDIGNPTNFRHIQHVGWDAKKEDFEYGEIGVDDSLKAILEKAGVSATQFKDKDTRKFIYKFIAQNGGLNAVKSSAPAPQLTPPKRPPPPVRSPASGIQNLNCPPPPPMPSLGQTGPPPPPPLPGISNLNETCKVDGTVKTKIAPVVDDRSNLLAEIQKGVGLKKVSQASKEHRNSNVADGIAGALARALNDRRYGGINPDSSDDDDDDSDSVDDNEWD